jgi:DNA-binding beta-propeller fold protein YncE
MQMLVTSARLPNGGGHGALLAFDIQRQTVSAFINDPRITDPRGLAVRRDDGLLFVNGGPHRIVAINLENTVVRDSGILDGFDIGGANFDNDGCYCFTMRNLGTIGRVSANLEMAPAFCLPLRSVHFPRGFAYTPHGVYLASGVGPDGTGDNTIYRFTPDGNRDPDFHVEDPELSPLDLLVAPNGNVLVSSETPFAGTRAATTIREYDGIYGGLVRVFSPTDDVAFEKPRGLRFGPDGGLYCVAQDEVALFDFISGRCLGPVIRLPGLNGQALEFFP